MIERIKEVRSDGDSVGGVLECVVRGCPRGLGEPVFEKLDADLAKAMLSLPATKGFEIGSGFRGQQAPRLEHNDPFRIVDGQVRTTTNLSGGVQGASAMVSPSSSASLSNPPPPSRRAQDTVTVTGENASLAARGRHDPCVLPRAVPMVEAMTALVLVDHLLRSTRRTSFPGMIQGSPNLQAILLGIAALFLRLRVLARLARGLVRAG